MHVIATPCMSLRHYARHCDTHTRARQCGRRRCQERHRDRREAKAVMTIVTVRLLKVRDELRVAEASMMTIWKHHRILPLIPNQDC